MDRRSAPLATLSAGEISKGLGARIRFLRRQRGTTLDRLAASTGLTKSDLSKVERGLSVPSISAALKVASSCNLSVGQLVGEERDPDAVCVARKKDRRSFMRRGSLLGYNYEPIAAAKPFKSMEPFIVRPPFTFQDNRTFHHTGEEFIYVLAGTMEVELSKRQIRPAAGDAIDFDAHLPHRSRSLGAQIAEALVVVKG